MSKAVNVDRTVDNSAQGPDTPNHATGHAPLIGLAFTPRRQIGLTESAESDEGHRHIRVLVVEDHRMVAEALAAMLGEQTGIEVLGTAGSMAEARKIIRSRAPDVVLMDYQLPDGYGTELTAEITAVQADTRVVIVTASDAEGVFAEAIQSGCSGYVRKSGDVQELVNAVHAAHAGRALFPAPLVSHMVTRARHAGAPTPFGLTPRELEVLHLLSEGMSTRAMMTRLGVTLHTMRNYVQAVLQKLDAHSKVEAVAVGRRDGAIPAAGR